MNRCPKCDAPLVALKSQNKKLCVDCLNQVPHELKPNQEPLIKAQR